MSNINYNGMYAPKGAPYNKPEPLPEPDPPQLHDKNGKKIQIKLPGGIRSYYTLPRQITPGRAIGESRIHGDASHEVQKKSIDAIIEAAKNHGLSQRETAHVLAIAYVEAGFNPDAAAGTTTAAGLGQFVRATGWGYGLNDTNRFELKPNVDALIRHYIENKNTAKNRGITGKELEQKIYQYHHDGAGSKTHPAKDRGGLAISTNQIIPYTDKIEKMLNGEQVALKPQKPAKKPTKSSQTAATKPVVSSVPKWSNPNQSSPSAVRNPTPPPNYHNTRNALALQSKAGKPTISNQPKASLLNRLDSWLYDKLCLEES